MPAGYAHITLAQESLAAALAAADERRRQQLVGVMRHLKFCIAGSVAPDYPYLDIGNRGAKRWAARLHSRPATLIRSAVRYISSRRERDKRERCTAWLCGFASHAVADGVIHPVINLLTGPYELNGREHRICEMHQDALVYRRLSLGEIGSPDQLTLNLRAISSPSSADPTLQLDVSIAKLWLAMVRGAYSELFSEGGDPLTLNEIHRWHSGFGRIVAAATDGKVLVPALARHLLEQGGLFYPELRQLESRYLESLPTPSGDRLDYETIYRLALDNCVAVWSMIFDAIEGDSAALAELSDWELDSGVIRDSEHLLFWSGVRQNESAPQKEGD